MNCWLIKILRWTIAADKYNLSSSDGVSTCYSGSTTKTNSKYHQCSLFMGQWFFFFFFFFISVLSDRLPWQGPWGGQPWRFSGPPPRHRFGHWGVKADQSGTLNQAVSHLPHGAPGQLHSIPTVSLWLPSTKKMFLIFISEAFRKWVTRNLGRRYISCHELILQLSIAVVDA